MYLMTTNTKSYLCSVLLTIFTKYPRFVACIGIFDKLVDVFENMKCSKQKLDAILLSIHFLLLCISRTVAMYFVISIEQT